MVQNVANFQLDKLLLLGSQIRPEQPYPPLAQRLIRCVVYPGYSLTADGTIDQKIWIAQIDMYLKDVQPRNREYVRFVVETLARQELNGQAEWEIRVLFIDEGPVVLYDTPGGKVRYGVSYVMD